MKTTQKQKVIRHLESYGKITPLDAFKDYAIMRLGAIIFTLREEGYIIKTEIENSFNRFGEPTHYAKYSLIKEYKQGTLFNA
jgi:hypothetical protein